MAGVIPNLLTIPYDLSFSRHFNGRLGYTITKWRTICEWLCHEIGAKEVKVYSKECINFNYTNLKYTTCDAYFGSEC